MRRFCWAVTSAPKFRANSSGSQELSPSPFEREGERHVTRISVDHYRWIVIEDIDLAPLDVLSVLIPLLETQELFIPGRGEAIKARQGFQLFATQPMVSR